MSKPPFIRKFRIPIYSDRIWVVVHPSISRAIDYVEDLIPASIGNTGGGVRALTFTYKDDKSVNRTILFFNPNPKPGLVAHEVKHVINFVFGWSGVRLSTTNDESECYLLEWMTNKVHSILDQAKNEFPRRKRGKKEQSETLITNS